MPKINRITGIQEMEKKAQQLLGTMGEKFEQGCELAGAFLQRKSQEIVPVDMGELKNSAFTRNIGGGGFDCDIVVGYTAAYAAYVHEDLSALHGEDFNLAYADKIANRKKRMAKRRKEGRAGMHDFYHSRGPEQQAKFLEAPARRFRNVLVSIIKTAMGIK